MFHTNISKLISKKELQFGKRFKLFILLRKRNVGSSLFQNLSKFDPLTLCYSFSEDDVSERYTTWSNMVRQKEPPPTTERGERGERGRTRTREENNINNNMDSSRKSRYTETKNKFVFFPKTISK